MFTVPLDPSSVGTSTLIWPPVPTSAKIGAAVLPNRTLTPATVVEGNADALVCDPKLAPNTETIEPAATTPEEPKLAPFRTAPMAGAVPTGKLCGRLATLPTVTTTGSIPIGALLGTPK